MDQTVKERLVGMGVLLVLGVIFIPLILNGNTLELGKKPGQNLNLPVPVEGITHEMNFADGNVRRITLPHPENNQEPDASSKNSSAASTKSNSSATIKTAQQAIPSSGFINELPKEPKVDSKLDSTLESSQPSGTIERNINISSSSFDHGLQSSSALQTDSKLGAVSAWVVQIGSFGDRKNAEKEVASLKAKGFPAFVRRFVTAEDKVLYRVRIGPEKDRSRAEKLSERLSKAGIKGQIVADP